METTDKMNVRIPDEMFTRAEFKKEQLEETGFSNYSYWQSTLRTFFKSTLVKVIVALVSILILYTIIYPMVTDRDPYKVSLLVSEWNLGPSAAHPFGTDGSGRDIWARVWFGTRTSLLLALLVAFFEVGIGVVVGALWGFYRKLDTLMFAIYNCVKNARAYAEGTLEQSEVGFVADDDYTLTVTFESEGLENLYAMADNSLHPVQQAFVETVGAAYGSSMENIMGNGPMVITEWSHENQMVLEKNPNYWNADSINITKLTGMCNVSGDTAVEMMLTGQVDLAGFTDPTYYDQLYSAGFEGITYCNTDQFLHINQNGHNEEAGRFLSNVNFRLALSYALDRAAICNTVMLGQTPATRLIDPDAVGLNGKFVDEYPIDNGINPTADANKAQEYLQMALTELGATIDDVPELSMLCYDSQGNLTKLQVIQDMFLTVLGVKCVIDPQPIQQMIAKVYSFDYDFWTGGVSIGTMDAGSPGGVLSYWDCNDPDALFGYNNVQYAELLDAAQQTTDLKTRYDAIAEMEKIFCNEIPSLLITWQTANVVYRPGIVITNIDMSYGADLAFADIAE